MTATDVNILRLSAAQLARRISERELSPIEVVDACIDQIERRDPHLNAFVFTDFEHARTTARAAEQAVVSGEQLGPLHGVPTAIKDLYDSRPGWPSTLGGMPSLQNFRASDHCLWAERMERAGAILLGKTNSPVLGFRGVTDNQLFGPTRNPFDVTRNSGGSSGGAAAAVADGMVPFAEGTDGGGSVRIPAAWCNLYGFKPSAGRVPVVMRPNAFGATQPFVHEGLITRTVEDAVLGLHVLAGYDARDPFSLDERPDYRGTFPDSLNGYRIAYSADFDIFPVDGKVATAVEKAVQILADAGASVEPVRLGLTYDQHQLSDLWCRMMARMIRDAVVGFRQAGIDLIQDLPPALRKWVDASFTESPLQASEDASMRTHVFDAIQHVFDKYDLLITPTVATPPVPNGPRGETVGPTQVAGVNVDPLIGWALTYPVNFTGHPAASLPAGFVNGLPVGMQVIGRRRADWDVLAASVVFEQRAPWREHYPFLTDYIS
ncbi:amidase [Streptomyces sp. DSM 41524]|uniref:Amidase n=1 Tax=Streptomyces asiaticus subsp. ignotus TaxID=3098222 RepID=A0ABU7QAE8_9ACTN|nr:amidase [Streptomyces sp. DSM 41524]